MLYGTLSFILLECRKESTKKFLKSVKKTSMQQSKSCKNINSVSTRAEMSNFVSHDVMKFMTILRHEGYVKYVNFRLFSFLDCFNYRLFLYLRRLRQRYYNRTKITSQTAISELSTRRKLTNF